MVVNDFGKFVAHTRYERLPADVVEAVKIRILDVLASGLVGFHLGNHRRLLPILSGAGEATVWGEGVRLALRDAVLINSFLAHSTYMEDGCKYAGGHPSSVVIPSALALAETAHASGRDLIAAVATGYEIFLRLGRATYPASVVRGFQGTAILGSVASAAGCSNLMQFDPEIAKNALAIACSLGVGLKEALKSSASQPLQVGRSSEGGLLAAMFARQGAAGADSIIEDGYLKAFSGNAAGADLLAGLGTKFSIFDTYLKVHGGCRGTHAPVDVVQDIVNEHAIEPEHVESVVVRIDSVTFGNDIHRPSNGNQAQFSAPFAVAAALLDGNASIFQFTDEKLADPRVRAMMARIRVEADTDLDKVFPKKRGASAEIVVKQGQRYRSRIDNAKGEPEDPLSAADIETKFLNLTKDILGGNAKRVRDMVLELEKMTDTGLLARHLKRDTSL